GGLRLEDAARQAATTRLVARQASGGIFAPRLLCLPGADAHRLPQLFVELLSRSRRLQRPLQGVQPIGQPRPVRDGGDGRADNLAVRLAMVFLSLTAISSLAFSGQGGRGSC